MLVFMRVVFILRVLVGVIVSLGKVGSCRLV